MYFTTTDTTDKLIDYLDRKLREDGSELPCTKEALRAFSKGKRAEIDCFELINLDNKSFRDAFYMFTFNNYPKPEFIESWEQDAELMQRREFQKKFLAAFTSDISFMRQHVRLYNCMYLDPSSFRPKTAHKTGTRIKVYHTFLPLYMRLPMRFRMYLKEHYRKYFFD